ncbi:hypothetical protein [Nocardioides sp.]|uniref:hypothetical protein n=1 Tax=Nocardioides sp. TaxID=35761 RepID=UPI00271A460B|nr:hypothetical protein [Nocardioides sp.]MDO9456220.1 hypothetical protein [Nocardioides sp.]
MNDALHRPAPHPWRTLTLGFLGGVALGLVVWVVLRVAGLSPDSAGLIAFILVMGAALGALLWSGRDDPT